MLRKLYDGFFIFILITAIMTSAGVVMETIRSSYRQFKTVDPELKPYLDSFYRLNYRYIDGSIMNHMTMGITSWPLKNGAVGTCTYYKLPDGGREIEISYAYWKTMTNEEKEQLVFHELAHCLCDLSHTHMRGAYKNAEKEERPEDPALWSEKGYMEDGCPSSGMHPRVLSKDCYRAHREHYIEETRMQCAASRSGA